MVQMAADIELQNNAHIKIILTHQTSFGKLIMRVGAATDNSQLFEVATKIGQKKISFIIDTCASVTILPHSLAPGLSINSTPVRLSAANGETIKCFGEIQLDIIIPGLRRSYPWTVVIADTINPLLGADFLRHYGLILNCSDGRLIDETTRRYVQGGRVTARIQNITVNNHSDLPERIQSLLQKFPKLTRPRTEQPLASNMRVTHVIDTGDNAPDLCPKFDNCLKKNMKQQNGSSQNF